VYGDICIDSLKNLEIFDPHEASGPIEKAYFSLLRTKFPLYHPCLEIRHIPLPFYFNLLVIVWI
jgi:hypothetical protein